MIIAMKDQFPFDYFVYSHNPDEIVEAFNSKVDSTFYLELRKTFKAYANEKITKIQQERKIAKDKEDKATKNEEIKKLKKLIKKIENKTMCRGYVHFVTNLSLFKEIDEIKHIKKLDYVSSNRDKSKYIKGMLSNLYSLTRLIDRQYYLQYNSYPNYYQLMKERYSSLDGKNNILYKMYLNIIIDYYAAIEKLKYIENDGDQYYYSLINDIYVKRVYTEEQYARYNGISMRTFYNDLNKCIDSIAESLNIIVTNESDDYIMDYVSSILARYNIEDPAKRKMIYIKELYKTKQIEEQDNKKINKL